MVEADRQKRTSASPLVYFLAFGGVGLLALFAVSGKYASRQAEYENQYRGIQEMQRRAGGEQGGETRARPASNELLITLRPLALVIAIVMLVVAVVFSWLGRRAPDASAKARQEDRE